MSSIRFYTDEHVDSAIVNGLRRPGVEVLTCQEAGLRTKSDVEHFEFFIGSGYVLHTDDGGCVGRAAEMAQSGQSHTGVVYCHQEKYGGGEQIGRLKELGKTTAAEEMVNRIVFLWAWAQSFLSPEHDWAWMGQGWVGLQLRHDEKRSPGRGRPLLCEADGMGL